MTADPSRVIQISSPETHRRAIRTCLFAGVWTLILCLLFYRTLGAMAHTWLSSETFTHGLVVGPISVWLMWRLRESLLPSLATGSSPMITLLIPVFAALWVVGELVSVQLVTQLAFVGMLVVGLLALLGLSAGRVAMFPLAFLFLMVPAGSGLEPPMMDLTAKYTVKLIQLTGIPVYQEGRFFELPSGSWSVVEACSGVRYLIASFTLGLIYAHLTYRSVARKLAFVLASIVVPIVANVIRAYLIVMLGHFSGMQLATGVDHLIYGWIFFGVVMLLLFFIGGFWRDAPAEDSDTQSGLDQPASDKLATRDECKSRAWITLLLAVCFAAAAPLVYKSLSEEGAPRTLATIDLPSNEVGSCSAPSSLDWRPRDVESDRRVSVVCSGENEVHLFADQYLTQEQGREVARYGVGLKGQDGDRWRVMQSLKRQEAIGLHGSLPINEAVLRRNRNGEYLLVWFWYMVNDDYAARPATAKLLELKHALTGGHRVSSRVYAAVSLKAGDEEEARVVLRKYLGEIGAELVETLSLTDQ